METTRKPSEYLTIHSPAPDGTEIKVSAKPSDLQVGGTHYKIFRIQPAKYAVENELGFLEGNAIKYITRHHLKGGEEDIHKAIHCLNLILEYKYRSSK
ncbi:MAG: DUF3310 domain-containing protein [Chloroflexi bacterium]|nr:MAG: DUF3310 domain-containing protein [Chloroflexota bacterium]